MLIDNFANLNRSTRNTIFTALVIIATIAMYNWILAPQVTCLSAAQQHESILNKSIEKNKATAHEIKTKAKRLKELHKQFADARNALFAPGEAKAFVSDLQAAAEETGCTVNSLNLVVAKQSSKNKQKKAAENTSGIVPNSIMLAVSGQYNSIIGLVEKLQNRPKKIWIDSFKIETIDLRSARLKCDMTITICTVQDTGTTL